jgi:hypothetical protein
MQSVEFDGLKKLDNDLRDIFTEIPKAKKELHGKIADLIKAEVDKEINSSGLNDSSGKIKAWQESTVGSGGGYAAGHAVKGETGHSSPGAITNYLENGHRIREPSGESKKYKPRIKKSYVDGYHFYQSASTKVEAKAIDEAERFVEEIKKKMEG